MTQKRCIRGEFLLRPDPDVVQVYLYVLGYCQQKYGVRLHEFVAMSNHDHPLYSDPETVSPRFVQLLHSLVARAVNRRFGEWDSLWSGQRHCAVRLLENSDVLDRCIYVLLNPVAAGCVRYAWDWEGATSWHMEYGVPRVIKKPDFLFSKKMPDTVELVIHRPKGLYPGLNNREARAKLREQARAEQGDLIAKRKSEGLPFMGMRRVLRQPRHNTPNTQLQRRGLRPHVAARSKWARVEALRDLKAFWVEHEAARLAFQAGDTDAEFPPGPI